MMSETLRWRRLTAIAEEFGIERTSLEAAEIERLRAQLEAAQEKVRVTTDLIPLLRPSGHDGDEESGQHDDDCAMCAYDALEAALDEQPAAVTMAQPPALPPLPDVWEEEHDGAVVRFTTQSRNTEMGVVADRYDVRFITPWRMVPKINVADLITVLRHAEAAHQRLQEGHRG